MTTLFVAAANASNAAKQRADYLCSGQDDQGVINAALCLLPPAGGRVALSEGAFHLSAPIVMRSNSILAGMGQGITRLAISDGANTDAVFVPVDDSDSVSLSDLDIDGNRAANDQGSGIVAQMPKDLTIRAITIRETCGRGMYLYHPRRALVEGCSVMECGTTGAALVGDLGSIVLEQAQDARIIGCHVEAPAGCGIHLRGNGGEGVSIVGNTIRGGAFIGIALCTNQHVTVQGNTVAECVDNGIDLGASEDVTVSGNAAANCGQGIVGSGGHRATITANTVSLTTGTDLAELGNGIHYGNPTEPSKGIVVQGNVIKDAIGHGIAFDNIRDGIIANNIIRAARDGIWLGSTAGEDVIGNIILGNRCLFCGIQIGANTTDNLVLGNMEDL